MPRQRQTPIGNREGHAPSTAPWARVLWFINNPGLWVTDPAQIPEPILDQSDRRNRVWYINFTVRVFWSPLDNITLGTCALYKSCPVAVHWCCRVAQSCHAVSEWLSSYCSKTTNFCHSRIVCNLIQHIVVMDPNRGERVCVRVQSYPFP